MGGKGTIVGGAEAERKYREGWVGLGRVEYGKPNLWGIVTVQRGLSPPVTVQRGRGAITGVS